MPTHRRRRSVSGVTCRIGAMACSSGHDASSCAMGAGSPTQSRKIGMSGTGCHCTRRSGSWSMGAAAHPPAWTGSTPAGAAASQPDFRSQGSAAASLGRSAPARRRTQAAADCPAAPGSGSACDRPSASRSTSCMSIGSMVGQLSMIVLKKVVSTGVNFAPASARKSAHIPLTPLTLLV